MKKRKSYPGSLYDLYGVERWLEQQAREGFLLEEFTRTGRLAVFQQGEPKRTRYHLEPDLSSYRTVEDGACEPGEPWDFICKVSGVFLVYESDDPWAVKPGKWKIEENYLRKKHRSLWLNLFFWIVTIALMGIRVIQEMLPENVAYIDWLMMFPLMFCCSVVLTLIEIWKGLPQLYDIRVWRRSFLSEEEIEPRPGMAVFRWSEQYLWILAIILMLFTMIFTLDESSPRPLRPLSDFDEPLPLVTLELTEEEIQDSSESRGMEVSARIKHRLLILDDIQITSKKMFLLHPNTEMEAHYYRLWTEGMASRVAADESEYCMEQMTHEAFDELWLSTEDYLWMSRRNAQCLVAREGDAVLVVRYYGGGDLNQHIDEIYTLISDYQHT